MKILITGASGNIGAKVADILLSQGAHQLRLCTRHPEKLVIEQAHGAEVLRGDLGAAFLLEAARGCDALFLMIPPSPTARNYREFQIQLAQHAAAAIRKHQIRHTVLLSADGAHLAADELGLVSGLNGVEQILRQAAPNLSILRPVFLMENFLLFLEEIQHDGRISLPISHLVKTPMIAAQDVAEAAARLLNRERVEGQSVTALHGAADYELQEAVEMIGNALGRRLHYAEVSSEQMRAILLRKGLGADYAGQLVEFFDALDLGLLQSEQPRDEQSTTPTALAEFAQLVLAPLLHAPELQTHNLT